MSEILNINPKIVDLTVGDQSLPVLRLNGSATKLPSGREGLTDIARGLLKTMDMEGQQVDRIGLSEEAILSAVKGDQGNDISNSEDEIVNAILNPSSNTFGRKLMAQKVEAVIGGTFFSAVRVDLGKSNIIPTRSLLLIFDH